MQHGLVAPQATGPAQEVGQLLFSTQLQVSVPTPHVLLHEPKTAVFVVLPGVHPSAQLYGAP